jgi:hypothetical protein
MKHDLPVVEGQTDDIPVVAELVDEVEQFAHVLVVVDHRVVVGRLPAPGLPEARGLRVRDEVHVRRAHPHEERRARRVLPLDEVLGRRRRLVVDRLHPLPCQRTRVLDPLPAHAPPARLLGRVVLVRRPRVDDTARPELLPVLREVLLGRIVLHLRLLLGVQVIKVAIELVEAVHGRQVLVEVAQVVLAEMPVA